jgi:hypothetical protein
MYRELLAVICAIAIVGFGSVKPAHAQWNKVLREGAEFLGKKVMKEGAQEAAEMGSKKILREAAQESTEQVLKRSSVRAGRYSDEAAAAVIKHGDTVAPLINEFGDDAAQAVTQITDRNARRLTMLTEELATSPQGADLMQLVAKGGQGDQIVDFLWKHRGKIAGTAILGTLLANTDAVLESGTAITTSAIETTGESLVEPLAEEAAPTLRYVFGVGVLMVLGCLFLATVVLSVYLYRYYRHVTRHARAIGTLFSFVAGRK